MNNIASIAISNTTRKFDKDYHYIIPDKYIGSIVPGMRVIVPFGKSNRLVEGYVLDVLESPEVSSLKEISRVIDEKPVLKENMIRLACWMKRQYICTYYDTIKCMLPPGTGVSSTKVVRLKKCEGGFKGNIKKIIDVLAECGGEMEYEELKKQVNTKPLQNTLII